MTTPSNRRVFMMQVAVGAGALAASHSAVAQEKLAPTDPYAKTMGFVLDTKQVDVKRWKKHTVDQQCSKCQLWDGKPADAFAACSFFGDQHTPNGGWCKNFKVKNAA